MLSNPWFIFLIGFVGGWLLEWAIDKVYFRPRLMKLMAGDIKQKQSERPAVMVTDLQNRAESQAEDLSKVNDRLETRIKELEEELKVARESGDLSMTPVIDVADSEVTAVEKTYVKAVTRDQLKRIKGIGPKYEGLLWNASILRFEQLANLKPEQIEAIIQPESWKKLDYNSWITEARELTTGERL